MRITRDLWAVGDRSTQTAEIGGKALGLSAILASGLPTPEARVIPTSVFRRYISELAVEVPGDQASLKDFAEFRRHIESTDPDLYGKAEIEDESSVLHAPLAIRSSATVEDSPTASWAGQFKTILGVDHRAVLRSVLRCWASAFAIAPQDYARRLDIRPTDIAMAVIIQELVRPLWAGVAFTDTNISGGKEVGKILIECVRGLGEKLVSGSSNAELRLQIDSFGSVERTARSHAGTHTVLTRSHISEDAISSLVAGIGRLESTLQSQRVDIEWAWDGTTMWFLQARQLTR